MTKILVIDDVDETRATIREMLERLRTFENNTIQQHK